jgi:Protein of unknown function DUF262
MMNHLQIEIDKKRKEISTDGYPMSIGELARLYIDKELDLHPEFQRFFKWSTLQQSKLIESILLGIPLPSIFVAQRDDGVWDVVDGLQRLSILFQFMGILTDEKGQVVKPVPLVEPDYLKSLAGKFWENKDKNQSSNENALSSAQRLAFKREKMDVKIIRRDNDASIKFELFQRLNPLGSKLSNQEMRNCLLVLLNDDFYKWLLALSKHPSFANTLPLAEKVIEEQYDMELALRFLIFKRVDPNKVRNNSDWEAYITDEMRKLATDATFDFEKEANDFKKTFDLLDFALGEDAFKKFDKTKDRFAGNFLIAGFEAIAFGLGRNINLYNDVILNENFKKDIISKIKNIWFNPEFQRHSGLSSIMRIPKIVPIGEKAFAPL